MDPVNPLDLLTRDGWHHVILRLKEPKEILTIANTNFLFRSILQNDRKEVWMSTLFYLAFPYFSDCLKKQEVLNLRLVKWIKPIIDNYLQQQKILAFNNFPLELKLDMYLDLKRQNRNDFCTLLEEMRTLPIAKLLNYAVSYCSFQENYLDCLTFFEEFGSQVTHLEIEFSYESKLNIQPTEALKFLKNILDCVPNVTELNLFFDCIRLGSGLPYELWVQDVKQLWNHCPLPDLPKLNSFSTCVSLCEHDHVDPCYATPVIRSVLKAYAEQITYLDMYETPKPMDMIPAMPALKTLHVELQTVKDVASLLNLQAPLAEINIRLWNVLQPIQSKQIFCALEHFKDTLLAVHISTDDWKLARIRKLPLKVNLPILKHLKLTGYFNGSTGPNFPFLENFPKLQTFDLELVKLNLWDNESSDDELSSLQETSLLSDAMMPDENYFYNSTIWTILPDLKSVNVRIRPSETLYLFPSFTKKAYDNYKKVS